MKVLLADDDPIIRQVLSNLLTKWGYEPIATTNGAEALEALNNDSSLQISLFDWMMPELSGLDLTRKIREMNITPFHIIMITARDGKESLLEALEAGADDFVQKPFDREILHARIRVGERSVNLQSYLIQELSAARARIAELGG
ncbi:MAG: DNA-binding response OmpR family regulator [Limisphaerales bacterium]|jgi:DNA-binding response OmpR family regulator